jgi:DDE superfamily endonuclease
VGLYLEPPENAVVVCVDEKTQIQALDRTRPVLPMRPGIPERQTHDYIGHGTTTLLAALEAATGTVTDACYPRHRHGEFLRFLKKVTAAYPGQDLHVVCGNYATHKHADVRKWLGRPENQRITLHFVPTSCSWLNLAECFFSVITRQAIRCGIGNCWRLRHVCSAWGKHWQGRWFDGCAWHDGRFPGQGGSLRRCVCWPGRPAARTPAGEGRQGSCTVVPGRAAATPAITRPGYRGYLRLPVRGRAGCVGFAGAPGGSPAVEFHVGGGRRDFLSRGAASSAG